MQFTKISSLCQKPLYLVQGKDKNGFEAFYYLQLDNVKAAIFAKEIWQGMCDLSKFGKVLFSGFGKPNAIARTLLRSQYGYEI